MHPRRETSRDRMLKELAKQAVWSGSLRSWMHSHGVAVAQPEVWIDHRHTAAVNFALHHSVTHTYELPWQMIPTLQNLGEPHRVHKLPRTKTIQKIPYEGRRDYTIEQIASAVEQGTVEPPLLFQDWSGVLVVDGRTRLSCAYVLKCNITVETIDTTHDK